MANSKQLRLQIKSINNRILSTRKSIKQLLARKKLVKRTDISGKKRLDDQIFAYLTRINSMRQQKQKIQIQIQRNR